MHIFVRAFTYKEEIFISKRTDHKYALRMWSSLEFRRYRCADCVSVKRKAKSDCVQPMQMQFEIERELSFSQKDCARSRRSSNGFREGEEEKRRGGRERASDLFSLLYFPATRRVPEGASRERLSQRIRARRERKSKGGKESAARLGIRAVRSHAKYKRSQL